MKINILSILFLVLCVPNYLVAQSTSNVSDEVIAHYTRLGDNEKLKADRFLVERGQEVVEVSHSMEICHIML